MRFTGLSAIQHHHQGVNYQFLFVRLSFGYSNLVDGNRLSLIYRFCGKISDLHYDEASHTAHITFERQQAAKTALMLHGGALDGANIQVESDSVTEDQHSDERPTTAEGDHIEQHDKPRAGIVAEMLAKGYILTDTILHKAIVVDQKQVTTDLRSFCKQRTEISIIRAFLLVSSTSSAV
jgi:hypothetical protein